MAGKYPDVISPEELAKHAHISTEEVRGDISDTEQEVRSLDQMERAYGLLTTFHINPQQRVIYSLKLENIAPQRAERRDFLTYLRALLAARGESHATA